MKENSLVLKVNNLKTYFYLDEGILKAVDEASLEVKKKRSLGVIGEGCGKSVTARSILRIVLQPGKTIQGEILLYQNGKKALDLVQKELRNFIDHPGLHTHNFPRPGIDRDGVSCPLNIFYYGFLHILSEISMSINHWEESALSKQVEQIRKSIKDEFLTVRYSMMAKKMAIFPEEHHGR